MNVIRYVYVYVCTYILKMQHTFILSHFLNLLSYLTDGHRVKLMQYLQYHIDNRILCHLDMYREKKSL